MRWMPYVFFNCPNANLPILGVVGGASYHHQSVAVIFFCQLEFVSSHFSTIANKMCQFMARHIKQAVL